MGEAPNFDNLETAFVGSSAMLGEYCVLQDRAMEELVKLRNVPAGAGAELVNLREFIRDTMNELRQEMQMNTREMRRDTAALQGEMRGMQRNTNALRGEMQGMHRNLRGEMQGMQRNINDLTEQFNHFSLLSSARDKNVYARLENAGARTGDSGLVCLFSVSVRPDHVELLNRPIDNFPPTGRSLARLQRRTVVRILDLLEVPFDPRLPTGSLRKVLKIAVGIVRDID